MYLNYMNFFGKKNNNDYNEFTIIPELTPNITTELGIEKHRIFYKLN